MKVTAKPRFIGARAENQTMMPERAPMASQQPSARKDLPVCKNCKEFRNKPGFCKLKNKNTARKATCEEFAKG